MTQLPLKPVSSNASNKELASLLGCWLRSCPVFESVCLGGQTGRNLGSETGVQFREPALPLTPGLRVWDRWFPPNKIRRCGQKKREQATWGTKQVSPVRVGSKDWKEERRVDLEYANILGLICRFLKYRIDLPENTNTCHYLYEALK